AAGSFRACLGGSCRHLEFKSRGTHFCAAHRDPAGSLPMLKRVVLFLATNLAVLALLGVIMSVFGINPQSMGGLLVMAVLFGFGGSLISLLSSKWVAKRAAGLHVIDRPNSDVERWLVDTVARQAQAAGIGMPEVAIYDAPEI